MRAAAAAWTASAEAIDAHSGWAAIAAITFVARPVPESDDVHRICNAMTDHLRSLARAHRSLASACNELAHHLDALHHEAIQEIESLLEWTAAIEGAGALASAVTLGAAEGPTQDVETARVGLTAARIAELISDFIGLAVDAAAGLPVVEELAASITIRMEELFGSRLAAAGLTAARGLPAAIRTTRATRLEMAAERDIASGAERVIPTISKQTSPIWRGLKPVRGSSIRTNGLRGSTKRYYAWDHTHEDIEVFDHNRRHLGSMDAKTGVMTKDAVKGRKIDGH